MGDADLLVPVTPDADKLLAIVRRLAESDPLQAVDRHGIIWCWYCQATAGLHKPGCLWLNAKEVLDAQA